MSNGFENVDGVLDGAVDPATAEDVDQAQIERERAAGEGMPPLSTELEGGDELFSEASDGAETASSAADGRGEPGDRGAR